MLFLQEISYIYIKTFCTSVSSLVFSYWCAFFTSTCICVREICILCNFHCNIWRMQISRRAVFWCVCGVCVSLGSRNVEWSSPSSLPFIHWCGHPSLQLQFRSRLCPFLIKWKLVFLFPLPLDGKRLNNRKAAWWKTLEQQDGWLSRAIGSCRQWVPFWASKTACLLITLQPARCVFGLLAERR